jgi:hypothetical protein
MRAILTSAAFELTRPMNSSMIFGLLPAAGMTVGDGMSVGIGSPSVEFNPP